MSRFAKKAVILSVIFLLAVGGYFIWNQKHADPDIFYTSIEDANLPVVYMEMYGEAVNGLHGYLKRTAAPRPGRHSRSFRRTGGWESASGRRTALF